MSHPVTPFGTFNLIQYDTEQEFERAIVVLDRREQPQRSTGVRCRERDQ